MSIEGHQRIWTDHCLKGILTVNGLGQLLLSTLNFCQSHRTFTIQTIVLKLYNVREHNNKKMIQAFRESEVTANNSR